MKKRRLSLLVIAILLFSIFIPQTVFATGGTDEIRIETTLSDNSVQRGSRKTFDVIARLGTEKISSSVKLNGESVNANWVDANKDSYTLTFTKEGNNEIEVTATSGEKTKKVTYNLDYQKAETGDLIGYANFSLEGLTIGAGYLIDPIRVPIYEGENAAQLLDRVLTENQFAYSRTGNLESSFYLSAIGNGGHRDLKNGYQEPSDVMDGVSKDITGKVPAKLQEFLDTEDVEFDLGAMSEGEGMYGLGEFEYTYMSGWMYSVNNVFPNVGFTGTYPSDGDTIRVQFTLYGYGADIGGGYSMGGGETTDYYAVADKSQLIKSIAEINSADNKAELLSDATVRAAYNSAVALGEDLSAEQNAVNEAATLLSGSKAGYEKVKAVEKLINEIGKVSKTSKAKIDEARMAYNMLDADLREKVANASDLADMEKEYNEIVKEQNTDKKITADTKNADAKVVGSSSIPQTGDEENLAMWMLSAIAALTILYGAKKKITK